MSPDSSSRQDLVRSASALDELVELRDCVRSGQPLKALIGAGCLKELVAFEVGYGMCSLKNGHRDIESDVFWEWLRARGEYPGDWTSDYLSLCGGDHDKAMMRLLDFMAEYVELRKHKPLKHFPPPPHGLPTIRPSAPPERFVSLLDVWMKDYPEIQRGRPLWFFFGHDTLPTVVCYVLGFNRCRERHGWHDVRWESFLHWFTNVEHLPAERWAPPLLERCGMDHKAAIHRLLDRVAEFVQAEKR